MLKTVFKAAAFWSLPAEFGTLVQFLVVAVFEAPTLYIAWIKVESVGAPRISWKVMFDIYRVFLYPRPRSRKYLTPPLRVQVQ